MQRPLGLLFSDIIGCSKGFSGSPIIKPSSNSSCFSGLVMNQSRGTASHEDDLWVSAA